MVRVDGATQHIGGWEILPVVGYEQKFRENVTVFVKVAIANDHGISIFVQVLLALCVSLNGKRLEVRRLWAVRCPSQDVVLVLKSVHCGRSGSMAEAGLIVNAIRSRK